MITPNITAGDADSLRKAIDADWASFRASNPTTTLFNERAPMWKFLSAVAGECVLEFPLTVTHTSSLVPDFSIQTANGTIGVEASLLASQNMMHLSSIPVTDRSFLSIAPLFVEQPRLKRQELFDAVLADDTAVSAFEMANFRFQTTQTCLKRKSEIRRGPGYRPHDRNWLLLWDKVSLSAGDFTDNYTLIREAWDHYWRGQLAYDLVIIAQDDLRRFALVTPEAVRLIARTIADP